jgi:hypothetical protein
VKKSEPIKATYYPPDTVFMIPTKAKMMFDRPLSLEQIEKITDYLAGGRYMSRMPGKRKAKEVTP